jgi:membrane protease YdiL (CAAX protease family)
MDAGAPGSDASLDRPAALAALALAWLALAKWLGPLGLAVLPRSLLAHFTVETWGMLVQVVMTATGLALAAGLLRRPARALGAVRPRADALGIAALAAPAVFVASSATALQVALPYLLQELETQGAGASARNAGAFGQAVKSAPVLVTLLWGALLAAVSEELVFRGALWSAVRAAVVRAAAALAPPRFDAPDPAPATGGAHRLGGALATVVAAAAFGWMHADMPGSVGIVRVVSTTCLGLACGVARFATGSVLAAMALHLVFNTLSIGIARRWFASDGEPLLGALPNPLLAVAAVALVAAAAVAGVARLQRRRAAA